MPSSLPGEVSERVCAAIIELDFGPSVGFTTQGPSCNTHSHIVTGAQAAHVIDAAASGTGSIYMHEKLALLRTLAARPSPTVAPCLQSLLEELAKAGYVATVGINQPDG
jgi:hypothetical protein